jgi:dihydrodipicolinate synthase/N-acetylneuraminate lyase
MKTAMYLSGRLKCDAVRKPIKKPEGAAYQKIQSAVKGAGF